MSSVAELDEVDTPDDGPAEPTTAVEVPFWQKYNAHFEFPSSVVLSVLAFVSLFAVIVAVLLAALAGGPDKKPVPITMVVGGEDDTGDGRLGSGGLENPVVATDQRPQQADQQSLPTNTPLPEVKNTDPQPRLPNLDKPGELSDPNLTEIEKLFDALRKPGPAGGKKGANGGPGSGTTGEAGDGPGGSGNDNTRARSLRWSLKFRYSGGRDYIAQLAAMRAILVVPEPPAEKDAFVYRDLSNPKHGQRLAQGDWVKLASQIQFIDTKADSMQGVAEALGLGFTPRRFLAFFPKELEDELARKEVGYRNRRAEDIAETVFRVSMRGGQYEIMVEDQKAKR